MRIIEIIVSPKGETTLRTQGFAGPACREASQFIERAWSANSETLTTEFHQAAVSDQVIGRRAESLILLKNSPARCEPLRLRASPLGRRRRIVAPCSTRRHFLEPTET